MDRAEIVHENFLRRVAAGDLPAGNPPAGPLAAPEAVSIYRAACLSRALDRLDPEARALVVLREIDGLTYEDIAATMELPLPTVKTRLFRARQTLKRAMEEWQ